MKTIILPKKNFFHLLYFLLTTPKNSLKKLAAITNTEIDRFQGSHSPVAAKQRRLHPS